MWVCTHEETRNDNLHVCIVPFLLQSLFDHIPVGVGSKGMIPLNAK